MLRQLSLLLLILICAPAAFAQNTQPTPNAPTHFEYFVGYTYERADNVADQFNTPAITSGGVVIPATNFTPSREGFNGWIAEFVANVHPNIGIVSSASGVYRSGNIRDTNGNTFRSHEQLYQFLWGVRFNARTNSRATPFGEAMIGYAHLGGSLDNFAGNSRRSQNGFAMAFGGGLDLETSERFGVRVFQFDYAPTWIQNRREDNYRFAVGIKIK